MVYSIILFLCIILFVGVHELLRRTAIRHIKESDNADESFKDEKFIRQFIQIGDKDNPILGYFTLDRKQFHDAIGNGFVECSSCPKRIKIKRNPSQDFYL